MNSSWRPACQDFQAYGNRPPTLPSKVAVSSAQEAVEAPRFQSSHFYNSFGFHEFTPGRVSIEGRIPKPTIQKLIDLGHLVQPAADWSNTSAPTVIQVIGGVLNGGADPRRARYVFGR